MQESVTKAEGSIAALKKEHDEGRQKVQELINADKEINNQLEEKKILYIDVVTEKAKLKNMISSLGKNIEDLKKREERESREIDEDKKKLADLTGRLQSVNEGLTNGSEEIHQLEEKRETISGEIEKSKSDLQLSEEKIAQIKEEIGSKFSRLNSLKEFQEAYKWGNEGLRQSSKIRKAAISFTASWLTISMSPGNMKRLWKRCWEKNCNMS